MNIRLSNARILDLDENLSIRKGWIEVSDGVIKAVHYADDPEPDPSKEAFDREIDCKDNLIMRGFNDAHAHSAMTFLRSKIRYPRRTCQGIRISPARSLSVLS